MSNRDSRVFGKKYACPGCNSLLKFKRPPRTVVHTCPNCRRILRLRAEAAAGKQDEQLQTAIDALAEWKMPEEKKPYDYHTDPLLDEIDTSSQGVWQFDQPWPPKTLQKVSERAEVNFNPDDADTNMLWRKRLLDGFYRREL